MPDLRKFSEMVIFFTERLEPWKTKMNKLLFYTDFTAFKRTGFSMSGIQYRALPMGPVPNNFNGIFEYLANRAQVEIQFINFPDGGIGEQFKPTNKKTFDKTVFNEEELKVLESVAERFKNTSTAEIIDISHKELAWIENQKERKIIDYYYSFELN